MQQQQAVVAFAFGVPSTIRSNQRVKIMSMVPEAEGILPIFTQRDIEFHHAAKFPVTYVEEKEGDPPPTLRIARAAVKWAIEKGYKHLYIACALPHAWRCSRDLTMAVKEAKAEIRISLLSGIYDYTEDSWYCSDSTQPRVRSRTEWWWGREFFLRYMPYFIYKRIAS